MKIAICSTYLHGGGGIAANRLKQALTAAGHEVSMIVSTQKGIFNIPFVAERLSFLPYEKDKSVRFLFSLANFGLPLHKHPDVLAADIIHLHWINQGLLSLNGIKKLKELGKPIIWTLHDMWVFTGGCHYNRGCDGYLASCGNCPYLKNPEKHDLSNRLWKKKEKLFRSGIEYVTCSNWLAERARGSSILRSITINSIPNPINIDIFRPINSVEKEALRKNLGLDANANILLFLAMNSTDERKGFRYLKEALAELKEKYSSIEVEVLVLGKTNDQLLADIGYKVHAPGMISGEAEIAQYYAIADLFVIPSLEDNLPNTVMEAMSCGTPVVGFSTGGIPEMVDTAQNGYIVEQRNSSKLADSIASIFSDKILQTEMSFAARAKVLANYNFEIVAARYLELYTSTLKRKL